MQNSKLIQLLSTFSVSEMRQFREFVHSPYHNKNEHVQCLCRFLHKKYPHFPAATTTREDAHAFIFPNKKHDDLKIRHLISMLFQLAEEFLIVQGNKQQPVSNKVQLMRQYKERGLAKQFQQAQTKGEQLQQKRGQPTTRSYFDRFEFELVKEEFQEQQQERRKVTNLQAVADNLDVFYILNKLKQSCAIYSYQNVFRQHYNLSMVDEVLQHLQNHQYDVPLVQLYHAGLLSLIKEDDEAHFTHLKQLLNDYNETVPKQEIVDLHVIARNYCIKRINMGEQPYIRELFDLYKLGLDSEILQDSAGKISSSSFKNVIAVGLKLAEFDWVEQFIRDYAESLDARHHEDYLNYNLAKLNFAKGAFHEVLSYLSNVEYQDLFMAADAKVLQLKTYYELGEIEPLMALLDSFEQYLHRKEALAYHRENYKNIIHFLKSIIHLEPGNKKKAEQLDEKIAACKVLTERQWLREKIA